MLSQKAVMILCFYRVLTVCERAGVHSDVYASRVKLLWLFLRYLMLTIKCGNLEENIQIYHQLIRMQSVKVQFVIDWLNILGWTYTLKNLSFQMNQTLYNIIDCSRWSKNRRYIYPSTLSVIQELKEDPDRKIQA